MARKERRDSHRYTPVMEQACLGWWEGREFRSVSARLRNLSSSGARVVVEGDRPAAQRVWIWVAGQPKIRWVPATLLAEMEDEPEPGSLRLSFAEPFPYESFKAAVWGEQGRHCGSSPAGDLAACMTNSRKIEESGSCPTARSEAERIRFFLGIDNGRQAEGPRSDAEGPRATVSPHPPTLVEAYHAQQVLHDRLAPISWLTISAISLLILVSILAIVTTRLEDLRWLSGFPFLFR